VPPEEYIKLMGEAGFDGARCVGAGVFFTSPTTRSMDFVAVKSAAAPVAVRKASFGLKPQQLVVFGVVAIAALTVARLLTKRS
jgi:hypothetical protein